MTPTAPTPPAEWLARGLAALDARFAKAKAEKFTVKVVADRQFAVTDGDGGAYAVDFTATPTGVCSCPDFQSRGSLLHACQHTARIVLEQWPTAYARYQAKVRELATASLTAQAAAAQSPPTAPAPATPPPTPAARELITAIVTATLSRAMTEVIEALAAKTAAIAEAVAAELAQESGQ